MSQTYWGNGVGPKGYEVVYAYMECRTSAQEEERAYVQCKMSVYVDDTLGSFVAVHRSWGNPVSVREMGWYGDSGWCDYGWVNYGEAASLNPVLWFTVGSQSFSSSISAKYYPDVPTWQPRNVSNVSASRQSDTAVKVSWSNNRTTARPYGNVYVEIGRAHV